MAQKQKKSFPGKIYNQLSSIKLAIILILILGMLSLLAIFLEEYLPTNIMGWEKAYSQKMGLVKFELLKFVGAFDPYHSFWYQIALAILVLNIIVCIYERTKGSFRTAFTTTFRKSPDSVKQLKNHAAIESPFSAEDSLDKVRQILSQKRFKLHKNKSGDLHQLFAAKGGYSRIGYLLFHFGLVSALIGGFFISLIGTTDYLWGRKGDILTPKGADFSVRVDDFKIETNKMGQIKDYLATLTVLENGQEIKQKVVEVNFPLRYKGYTFYQSSYRANPNDIQSVKLSIKKMQPTATDTMVALELHKKTALPHLNCFLTVIEFIPDFRIDADTIYSASQEPRNPAVQVIIEEPGKEAEAQWLFLKYPDFHRKKDDSVYSLRFLDLEQGLYTGLQVSQKPGSSLVWLGLITMTLGLLLSFYIFHRRLWVVAEETERGSSRLTIGGLINKNQEGFKLEFKDLVEQIKKGL